MAACLQPLISMFSDKREPWAAGGPGDGVAALQALCELPGPLHTAPCWRELLRDPCVSCVCPTLQGSPRCPQAWPIPNLTKASELVPPWPSPAPAGSNRETAVPPEQGWSPKNECGHVPGAPPSSLPQTGSVDHRAPRPRPDVGLGPRGSFLQPQGKEGCGAAGGLGRLRHIPTVSKLRGLQPTRRQQPLIFSPKEARPGQGDSGTWDASPRLHWERHAGFPRNDPAAEMSQLPRRLHGKFFAREARGWRSLDGGSEAGAAWDGTESGWGQAAALGSAWRGVHQTAGPPLPTEAPRV